MTTLNGEFKVLSPLNKRRKDLKGGQVVTFVIPANLLQKILGRATSTAKREGWWDGKLDKSWIIADKTGTPLLMIGVFKATNLYEANRPSSRTLWRSGERVCVSVIGNVFDAHESYNDAMQFLKALVVEKQKIVAQTPLTEESLLEEKVWLEEAISSHEWRMSGTPKNPLQICLTPFEHEFGDCASFTAIGKFDHCKRLDWWIGYPTDTLQTRGFVLESVGGKIKITRRKDITVQ
jgi:hypothetical protein